MFLNQNSFKKRTLHFSDGDDFYTLDGVKMLFKDVTACYMVDTAHFTNRAYQGNCLRLILAFPEASESEVYEVDSNHREVYAQLNRLASALLLWRRKRLYEQYQLEKEVQFPLRYGAENISICEGKVFVGADEVKTVCLKNIVKCPAVVLGLGERNMALKLEDISDSELFMVLVSQFTPVSIGPESKLSNALVKGLYIFIPVFGLNGWFQIYTTNTVVETISLFSGIILAVWVITWPFYRLVDRINARNMSRRAELFDKS